MKQHYLHRKMLYRYCSINYIREDTVSWVCNLKQMWKFCGILFSAYLVFYYKVILGENCVEFCCWLHSMCFRLRKLTFRWHLISWYLLYVVIYDWFQQYILDEFCTCHFSFESGKSPGNFLLIYKFNKYLKRLFSDITQNFKNNKKFATNNEFATLFSFCSIINF